MADLAKLTHGLAVVKQGLDALDSSLRQELSACGQLRKQIAKPDKHNQALAEQAVDVVAKRPGHTEATRETCRNTQR